MLPPASICAERKWHTKEWIKARHIVAFQWNDHQNDGDKRPVWMITYHGEYVCVCGLRHTKDVRASIIYIWDNYMHVCFFSVEIREFQISVEIVDRKRRNAQQTKGIEQKKQLRANNFFYKSIFVWYWKKNGAFHFDWPIFFVIFAVVQCIVKKWEWIERIKDKLWFLSSCYHSLARSNQSSYNIKRNKFRV